MQKTQCIYREPNTGKSNILETLGVFSLPYCGNLYGFVRIENMSDLFHGKEPGNKVSVNAGSSSYSIYDHEGKVKIDLNYSKGQILLTIPYKNVQKKQAFGKLSSTSHVPMRV